MFSVPFSLISVFQLSTIDALTAKIIAFHLPDERRFIFALFIPHFSALFEWHVVQKQKQTMR
jgi:hypothetical protein